jgi:hypothetical protein
VAWNEGEMSLPQTIVLSYGKALRPDLGGLGRDIRRGKDIKRRLEARRRPGAKVN